MRELKVAEQQHITGGTAAAGELTGWVPDNVLFAIRAGSFNFSIGSVSISRPIWTPGLIPGPIQPPVLRSVSDFGTPGYDC